MSVTRGCHAVRWRAAPSWRLVAESFLELDFGAFAKESTGDNPDRAAPAANDVVAAIAAPDDREPMPMSLDRDESDRPFDRQLAYLGLLDDAAPLFRDGSSVPSAGVLLALPYVVESRLFRISSKLYVEIGRERRALSQFCAKS
jgi:hypothetical protein